MFRRGEDGYPKIFRELFLLEPLENKVIPPV